MQKLYVYPTPSKKNPIHSQNPYIGNMVSALSNHFSIVTYDRATMKGIDFCRCSLKADVIIVNWLESIVFLKFSYLQFLFTLLGICFINTRNKKLIWMVHNIQPHEGKNKMSNIIMKLLAKHSFAIISHSNDAADFIKQNYNRETIYICHPIKPFHFEEKKTDKLIDFLIWGTILPYKGIKEFVSSSYIQTTSYRIHIAGKCPNKELASEISKYCNDNISFENRRIDFDELHSLIAKSKYVLFPYLNGTVSSSGVLIDTIALGGTPLGPHFGAFKDLHEEGVCCTYHELNDLENYALSDFQIDSHTIESFFEHNSWELFAQRIYEVTDTK